MNSLLSFRTDQRIAVVAVVLLSIATGSACTDVDDPLESEIIVDAQQISSPRKPVVPQSVLNDFGAVSESTLERSTPVAIQQMFGVSYATSSSVVDTGALMPAGAYSCGGFQKNFYRADRNVFEVDRSVRLTSACRFQNVSILITASNVSLDCNGSTFEGGPDAADNGLQLKMNRKNPRDDDDKTTGFSVPVIRNLRIQNCTFKNYDISGIYISNPFNRENPNDQSVYDEYLGGMFRGGVWDKPGQRTSADKLRQHTASNIELRRITVEDTDNAAIYIHDHVLDVDINELKASNTRLGVYLDHGSRRTTIRNSAFVFPKKVESKSLREYIAVDSSAENTIQSNVFYRNHAAGVRLYKNCSEHVWKPTQFYRRQWSMRNRISGNLFVIPDRDAMGVHIASRQWHQLASMECGDESVTVDGVSRYRDYASENTVSYNVFFNPGTGVRVGDDQNTVAGNTFYLPSDAPYRATRLGQVEDLPFGGRELKFNVIRNNSVYLVDDRGITDEAPPQPLSDDVFKFYVPRAMERTTFIDNEYQSWAVCREPFMVPASNNASKLCRFGNLSDHRLNRAGARRSFRDTGGDTRGEGTLRCTSYGWLMESGYCCYGDNCRHDSLAGRYYN